MISQQKAFQNMHSGCITARDHITPKSSILSKPEGNISSKNACKHEGYLCFIRKQRTNRLRKTGGNNKIKAV